ncbi:MAG: DNA-formamidopyrimidine glycosylase family protein [Mycobacteriaceae bacterium]
MPELPEVEAIVEYLRVHAVGTCIGRIDLSSLSALKTFDPPISVLHGREITAAHRFGKHLGIECAGMHLITHLSLGGWLKWSEKLTATPLKPGKGPIALRVHCGPPGQSPGFDLTEAGTQKRLAVWLVRDPVSIERIACLGPDALTIEVEDFGALLSSKTARIKNILTDQTVISGIGNAYSDEILHQAKISPFTSGKVVASQHLTEIYNAMNSILTEAVDRSIGLSVATLKGEKRSGLNVHGRCGLPCPACADTIAEVSFANRSFQYCPGCQTGGKLLADRRMSRLLK